MSWKFNGDIEVTGLVKSPGLMMNLPPKVGTNPLDKTVNMYASYNFGYRPQVYSWSAGMVLDGDDKEVLYYIASNGTDSKDLFRASKSMTDTDFSYDNTPIHHASWGTATVKHIIGLGTDWIILVLSSNKMVMLTGISSKDKTAWKNYLITNDGCLANGDPRTFTFYYDKITPSNSRLIEAVKDTNLYKLSIHSVNLSVAEGTSIITSTINTNNILIDLGVTIGQENFGNQYLDLTSNLPYAIGDITEVSAGHYQNSLAYIPENNSLIFSVAYYYHFNVGGLHYYKYGTACQEYNLSISTLISMTASPTAIRYPSTKHVWKTDYKVFGVSTGIVQSVWSHGPNHLTKWLVTYDSFYGKLYTTNGSADVIKSYIYPVEKYSNEKKIDFSMCDKYNFQVTVPDGCPWAKGIDSANILFLSSDYVIFAGNSKEGYNWILAQYTIVDNKINIVPGRWRFVFNAPSKYSSSPSNAMDPKNIGLLDPSVVKCVSEETGGPNIYLFQKSPTRKVMKLSLTSQDPNVIFNDNSGFVLSVTDTGISWPTLDAKYTSILAAGKKDTNLYFVVIDNTLGTHYTRTYVILKYNTTTSTWTTMNSKVVSTTNSAQCFLLFYGSFCNMLIDRYDRLFFKTYLVISGSRMKHNSMYDTISNVITIKNATSVWSGLSNSMINDGGTIKYIGFYQNEGIGNTSNKTEIDFTYEMSCLIRNDGKAVLSSNYTGPHAAEAEPTRSTNIFNEMATNVMYSKASVGLIAYIEDNYIMLGGFSSKIGSGLSVTLYPNTTNYVYLYRDSNDTTKVNAMVATVRKNNTFSRVCIGSITTNGTDIVSQETYDI